MSGDEWADPPPGFQAILFERGTRFYFLSFGQTVLGLGIIRVWGRKGGQQRPQVNAPFSSLAAAWPEVRGHIRARLRHQYVIVWVMKDETSPY